MGDSIPSYNDPCGMFPKSIALVDECAWLWSTTPKMEEDHRWERRAKRLEAEKHSKHEEEPKEEETPEEHPPAQATGEDNVEASKAKEDSAESQDKVTRSLRCYN